MEGHGSRRAQVPAFVHTFLIVLLGLNVVTLLTMCLLRERLGRGASAGSNIEEQRQVVRWSIFGTITESPRKGSPEVWAQAAPNDDGAYEAVRSILPEEDLTALAELCGRCLYHTLRKAVRVHGVGDRVFVATGDIDDMWIRDSSVQLGIYLPRVARRPALRRVLEGAMRTQAFYILQDPYANSFYSKWRSTSGQQERDRQLGRGGWVATRNYELDSGAYFINLLWNYFQTDSIFARERFLNDSVIYDAVSLMVDTWIVEQRHEDKSPYRYTELDRNGRGAESSYTGMSWSGFRPSDDQQKYGYNIPSNMYAAGALERALQLNSAVWQSSSLKRRARLLADQIRRGIDTYGMVEVEGGAIVYAYEVDGMGNFLTDFDDPNLPSLLSIPLLGYAHYDQEVYLTTVSRLLSTKNSYYYEGPDIKGLGSPHTGSSMVWPLSVMVQAMVSSNASEKAQLLQMLLHHMQCGDGLMHESVNANAPQICTRPHFEWANAMLVALYANSVGSDCDDVAERLRLEAVIADPATVTPLRSTAYLPGQLPAFGGNPLANLGQGGGAFSHISKLQAAGLVGNHMPEVRATWSNVLQTPERQNPAAISQATQLRIDPMASLSSEVRDTVATLQSRMPGRAQILGIPELSPPPSPPPRPPPPPPPPPERERINPMFFPQLEAEIQHDL